MIPVLVCVPAHGHITDLDGTFTHSEYLPSPIGYLRGFEAIEICDNEMVEKELKSLGLTMRYHIQGVRADHGHIGALISFAVEAPTYEEACKLPGFVPFGDWTGAYYWPPTIPAELTADFWPNSLTTVKRIALAECDGNKGLPPYKEDGSFHFSLIHTGQIASLVFLKEDAEYVYFVLHTTKEVEAVPAARECFAELQRSK